MLLRAIAFSACYYVWWFFEILSGLSSPGRLEVGSDSRRCAGKPICCSDPVVIPLPYLCGITLITTSLPTHEHDRLVCRPESVRGVWPRWVLVTVGWGGGGFKHGQKFEDQNG